MADGTIIDIGEMVFEKEPEYTNLIPVSVTSDGATIYGDDYNGDGLADGYRNNVRLRTNGIDEQELGGQFATGFIPVTSGDVIRIKGSAYNNNYTKFVLYDSGFANIINFGYIDGFTSTSNASVEIIDDIVKLTLHSTSLKWLRFSGVGNGANIIMTKNEEIV